jgi:LysR family glycine cleavage system transcriptional activator
MFRQRRYLPSISLLSAFEAVLRTGSTAAAARELQLSQGTVSRLVQNLEEQLGKPLFHRQRRRLVATAAAIAYGRDVTRALDLLQRSSMQFVANPEGGTLSVAILPAFGTRWLAPRLGGFLADHPGVSISLATRIRPFNIETEGFDAAIHFGRDDWPGARHLKIFDERLTACAAPAFLERRPVRGVADLAGQQLFQLETRPNAWPAWFAGQEAQPVAVRGMLFDQFAPMIQAAIAGLGVALLPDYLAEAEIAEGRLAPVLRPSVPGTGSYWLAWAVDREAYPPLEAFRSWLAGQGG